MLSGYLDDVRSAPVVLSL